MRIARPEFRLPHPRESRSAERIEGAPAAVRFVDLEAAETNNPLTKQVFGKDQGCNRAMRELGRAKRPAWDRI